MKDYNLGAYNEMNSILHKTAIRHRSTKKIRSEWRKLEGVLPQRTMQPSSVHVNLAMDTRCGYQTNNGPS